MKKNGNDLNCEKSYETNSKFDTTCLIKVEEAYNANSMLHV